MAIPYAGVHRKLKDADTPWEKKVPLARFAWVSPRCFLPNKEQVLIDWAANSLANAKKLSVPDRAVPSLWRFLHDALQTKRLLEMGSRAEGLSLRPSIFPVILRSLCIDGDHVELVVACCHSILGFQSLGSIITGTLDHQVQFLSTVINLLDAFLKTSCRNVPCRLNPLVQKAFANFASLQRQFPNPRKFFTVVYEKLLGPSLSLHHTITTLAGNTNEDSNKDTLKCIQDLVANGLFNRDLTEGHTKYLRSVPGQVATEKQREVRLLQDSIAALWKNMADRVNNRVEVECSLSYVAGMPVVFKAFLSAQKYPNDVSFSMFRKLCCIVGIMPAEHDGKPVTDVLNAPGGLTERSNDEMDTGEITKQGEGSLGSWTAGLPAVSELLKLVAQKQIYEVAVDNMSGKPKFICLCGLIDRLIKHADSLEPAWYRCLGTVLDMNHLILEDRLTGILEEALYCSDKTSLTLNAQHDRDVFLEKLLGTYTKLRQFDRVVTSMMEACKMASADAMMFSYPAQFTICFAESVQALPPGLTLDIWNQFLNKFLAGYLPEITQSTPTTSSPPPLKRTKLSNTRSKLNMAAIAVTFELFLRSVRLVDASLTVPLLKRVEELMREMKDGVLSPLLHLCSESKPSADQVYCTLLLSHVWGDLHLLLCQHTNYSDRNSFSDADESARKFGDFSFMHTYGTPSEWLHVCKMFAGKDKMTLIHVCLAVQQARALLLHSDAKSTLIQKRLVNIATTVCKKVRNINNSRTRKSLLPVLLRNLPFLLPFLPSQQLADLTSLLCETLMSSQTASTSSGSLRNQQEPLQSTPEEQGEDLEMCRICEEFVGSEFCMESKRLQTALVASVLGQVSKVIGTSSDTTSTVSSAGIILKKLSDTCDTCTSEEDGMMKRLDGIALECNQVLAGTEMVKMGNHCKLEVINTVKGALKILNFLPLHHLLPSNKIRCMLGLILIDHALTRTTPPKTQGSHYLSALLLCRQLAAAILKGITSKAEFIGSLDAWKVLCTISTSFIDSNKKVTKMSLAVTEVASQICDVTGELLTYWLKRLRQLPNQEAAFKEYSQMVGFKLSELGRHLTYSKDPHQILSDRLPLLVVSSTLLASLFASRGALGSLGSELALDLGRPILKTLCGVMKQSRGASTNPSLLSWLVKSGTILIKFTRRLAKDDSVNRCFNGTSERESDESDVMDMGGSIAMVAKEQWTGVLNPVLQEICTFFSLSGENSCPMIGVCLVYMQTSCLFISQCCDVGTVGMATSDMWLSLLSLMGTSDHWNESMSNDFQSTLSRITETMDLIQLKTLMHQLWQDTSFSGETDADHHNLRGVLVAWRLLPGCFVSEATQGALADIIPQLIASLLEVLEDAVRDWTLGGAVALSVLQAVSSVIGTEGSLVPPDEAMQAQYFCLAVPVAKVTTREFPVVFNTMCQIVRSLLIGYPRAVMGSLASYFACLQHLLKAVMHRGQQRSDTADKLSDHDLYMCAENMERLLTMLATYKNDVKKLGVFLVSDYIAELQKGTLLPLFKKTLVIGVYNLLDVCDERALDYLNMKLPHHLREIFKTFYSDFQKYYRYSGKV